MEITSHTIKGITSQPPYLPAWYRYDARGSELNDECMNKSTYYYFHREEKRLLHKKSKVIITMFITIRLYIVKGTELYMVHIPMILLSVQSPYHDYNCISLHVGIDGYLAVCVNCTVTLISNSFTLIC